MQWIGPLMPWQIGPDYPRWTEVLRDGSQVLVRPVTKQDATAERTLIEALSPQASRFRFLGQVRHPSSEMIEKFTDLDYVHDVAFAAVVPDDGKDKFVGVSRTAPPRTERAASVQSPSLTNGRTRAWARC